LLDNPFSFRIFGIDATSTNPTKIYDTASDVVDLTRLATKNKLQNETEYYTEIIETLQNYSNVNIYGRSRIDLLQFNIGRGDIGILSFGAYAEGESRIKTDFTNLFNQQEIIDSIESGEININTIVNQAQTNTSNPNFPGLPEGVNLPTLPPNTPNLNFPGLPGGANPPSLPPNTPTIPSDDTYTSPTGIDLGKNLTPVRIIARADLGGYLGLGKRLQIFSYTLEEAREETSTEGVQGKVRKIPARIWNAYASAGIRVRGYYRYAIPQFQIKIPRFLQLSNTESLFKQQVLRTAEGPGYGVDLYWRLAINDPILNTQIGVELRDVVNQTFYNTGQRISEDMQVNLGFSIQPLNWLDYPNITLGLDLENLERSKTKIQLGLSWKIGSDDYYIIPKIGYIMNESNLFGEYENIVTAGAEISLNALKLRALYEQNLDNETKMIGFGLSVDF